MAIPSVANDADGQKLIVLAVSKAQLIQPTVQPVSNIRFDAAAVGERLQLFRADH